MSTDVRANATAAGPAGADIPADRLLRLTDDQFRRMTAAGVFGLAEPVALVDGLVREGDEAGPAYRFRLDQYHRMDTEGVLTKYDRVELLGGRLVVKPVMKPPHPISTRRVRIAIERVLPPGWYADQQSPVSMPRADSEPEPDVQVTRGDTADYVDRHPGPDDVALLVEVSDATLSEDRGFMKRLYASEGVAAYWIVNIPGRRVEVHDGPSGPDEAPDYARRRDYGPGERIPVVIDGLMVGEVAVDDLLP